MKKLLSLSLATLLCACQPAPNQDDTPKVHIPTVAITSQVEHAALNAVRDGTIAQLKDEGFVEGENLKINYQNAQGNSAIAAQIAKQFAGENPDVIVPIGTASAQAVAAATQKIPTVFSAITDPVAAKLIADWKPTGTNITGVSNRMLHKPQVDLILKIVPNTRNIGYVYSPGEVNSVAVLRDLTQEAQKRGINVISAAAQHTADVSNAAKSLVGKVDVFYSGRDNNVVAAYEALVQVANVSKIPLIASDTDSVKIGAIAALGHNYFDMGRETGKMVARILRGEKAGDIMPLTTELHMDLFISPDNAATQGVVLDPALLNEATEIIKRN